MKALTQQYENRVREAGFALVCGVDEVGRGCWAGPIVAAGVIFEPDVKISGLHDSKKLTAKKREELVEEIKQKATAWSIQVLTTQQVDEKGVGFANAQVMRNVIEELKPDFALIDFAHVPDLTVPHEFITKGDGKVFSIGAASIIAKVYRDQLMVEFDEKYPGYGFANHKGYGTQEHREALEKLGICEIHRKSFKPISQLKLL